MGAGGILHPSFFFVTSSKLRPVKAAPLSRRVAPVEFRLGRYAVPGCMRLAAAPKECLVGRVRMLRNGQGRGLAA